jgi:hypothetical protein
MRWLLALGFALLAWGAQAQPSIIGPPNAVQCNAVATLAVGTTGLTQMVAAVTGQRIFVCGWHVTNTGATGTFLLANGTGSNCGTNTVTQIPALNVTSTAPSGDHQTFATFQTPISAALCVNPSVATIAVVVYYAQF